jgi:hypothetical protein
VVKREKPTPDNGWIASQSESVVFEQENGATETRRLKVIPELSGRSAFDESFSQNLR